jgi:hypothetical protein
MHRQQGKKYMAEVCLNTHQKKCMAKNKETSKHSPTFFGLQYCSFCRIFLSFFFNVQIERVQCAIDWPYTLKQYIFIYTIFLT